MTKYRIVTKNNKNFWVQQKGWFMWTDVHVFDFSCMPSRTYIPTKLKNFDSVVEAEQWIAGVIRHDAFLKSRPTVVKIIEAIKSLNCSETGPK